MTKDADYDGNLHRHRQTGISRAALAPVIMLPFLVFWILAATDDDESIALTRNDLVQESTSERTWHGTLANVTDSQYREIAVTIRFLDREDETVGEVSGSADQLEPGETLHLEAALPAEAARIQVYSLQWETGRKNKSVALGPWAPWSFGYVQTQWP